MIAYTLSVLLGVAIIVGVPVLILAAWVVACKTVRAREERHRPPAQVYDWHVPSQRSYWPNETRDPARCELHGARHCLPCGAA